MAFQLSPGVNVSEIDLTTVVPSVATSIGGLAGYFEWGPVDQVSIITSENDLVQTFGKPSQNNFTTFFTASNFLSYSQDLRVVRSIGSNSRTATSNTSASVLIKNENAYTSTYSSGNTSITFYAKYPGALGNNVEIHMCDSNTYSNWAYKDYFDSAPSTSDYASTRSTANDEVHIIIVDGRGKFSGIAGTILEKYAFASKAGDAKTFDGTSNYYKDVVNRKSRYVWWAGHPINSNWGISAPLVAANNSANTYATLSSNVAVILRGGIDDIPSIGDKIISYDVFRNAETEDINFLIGGDNTSNVAVANALVDIAEFRKDCIVFVSPPLDDAVDNPGDEADSIVASTDLITRSSYCFVDSGWKYQYDKYNDVYRWIPLNGDIAGLCARTDNDRDPWYSPAGLTRGVIKNAVKLAWNPARAERDVLYKNGINPVVSFLGEGIILFGDKTFQNRPSAFDRINVRRLFITLEKAIAKAARSTLFEFNDEFTRAGFVNLVEPFLREVKGRRGIYDYRVVCDSTNNTPEVIDQNQFVGDIYIKPARSVNFIQLNFVAVRTGVTFDEIVGKF
jgi:phage tail sheath protein FI